MAEELHSAERMAKLTEQEAARQAELRHREQILQNRSADVAENGRYHHTRYLNDGCSCIANLKIYEIHD